MSPREPLHFLLISRPRLEGYPPSLNQAAILNEDGHRVSIADQCSGQSKLRLASGTELDRFPLGSYASGGHKLGRLIGSFKFVVDARKLVRKLRPDWVLAYDPEACLGVGTKVRTYGIKLAWHFHETPTRGLAPATTVRWANEFVFRHPTLPDLIIFPDRHRARHFAKETGLTADEIQLVMNCPRLLRQVPRAVEGDSWRGSLPPRARLVVYSGSVGPNHGLENAVQSMPQWPSDAVLVVRGRRHPGFDEQLMRLATECGVTERVVRLDYSPGFDIYAGAHIGWTVNDHQSFNSKHSAGASNKRFDCLAVGVPQITDDGPGTPELVQAGGFGLCVPPSSVERMAEAVNRLLHDDEARTEMGRRARRAHLERLNYEAEFQPVARLLRSGALVERTTTTRPV